LIGGSLRLSRGVFGPRFVDALTELDYRSELRGVREDALRFSVTVLSAMTFVALAFQLYGSHLDWSHPMSRWLGANALVAIFFFVSVRSPWRGSAFIAPLFALICGLDVAVVAPLILASHGYVAVLLKYGYFGPVLLAFVPFLLLRMPFAEGMAINALVLCSYSLVIWLVPGIPVGHRLMHTNNLVLAAIAAGAGGWLLDSLQRENFARRREFEALLLNVLPASIAARLKNGESPIADTATEVSVVFADLVGFTPFAQTRTPGEVVQLLDHIFRRLDELAQQHGLEKIKTIGDAYLAVAGVPGARADHADAAARFALAVLDEVEQIGNERGTRLSLRIGMDCGPVVAGVIGWHKFSYDVWGDTVNTASRMESHGEAGRVQLTERAAKLLSGHGLEARGEIEVKGKGPMRTWWLTR
jgi:class 3 adenylate cyclase